MLSRVISVFAAPGSSPYARPPPGQLVDEKMGGQLGLCVGRQWCVCAAIPVQIVDVQTTQRVCRAGHRNHSALDLVAEQTCQCEMA